ncbi:MAG: L-lactate dehydrogenase [Firmicutes bacterium]|nr:L-lactate dehydrogenase [Bacillota bacterium]
MKNKVVIIGCGNVGMSYAYALLNQKTNVQELVLVDLNKERIEGEAMDLNHCLAFAPTEMKIKAGDYSDTKDASIVMIAAGANQSPGETRMDLINKNSKIFKGIVESCINNGFNGIFLVATNPLDVMTYLTYKYSNFPTSRVIGSGTCLDTARLCYMIGNKLNISPKDINAYVMGEHGDTEFVPWSLASVGLNNIKEYLKQDELDKISEDVKNAAYEIINKKGATYYGIGVSLVNITNAILNDESSILTVSSYDEKNGVYIGGPTILNKDGVVKRIFVNLNEEEVEKMQKSVDTIKDAIKKVL